MKKLGLFLLLAGFLSLQAMDVSVKKNNYFIAIPLGIKDTEILKNQSLDSKWLALRAKLMELEVQRKDCVLKLESIEKELKKAVKNDDVVAGVVSKKYTIVTGYHAKAFQDMNVITENSSNIENKNSSKKRKRDESYPHNQDKKDHNVDKIVKG